MSYQDQLLFSQNWGLDIPLLTFLAIRNIQDLKFFMPEHLNISAKVFYGYLAFEVLCIDLTYLSL